MADYTAQSNLYKWQATDEKLLTFQELNKNFETLDNAQLTKITSNLGGVKIAANSATDDVLAMIISAGIGFHTFYAANISLNLPGADSIRGFAHITGVNPTNGYVQAYDYFGNSYTNYILNGVWQGWGPKQNNITLQNGTTVFNGRTPRYSKDGKLVTIEGEINPVPNGTKIGTLPAGYRPPTYRLFKQALNYSVSNDGATVYVTDLGEIFVQVTTNQTQAISLCGISFYVD